LTSIGGKSLLKNSAFTLTAQWVQNARSADAMYRGLPGKWRKAPLACRAASASIPNPPRPDKGALGRPQFAPVPDPLASAAPAELLRLQRPDPWQLKGRGEIVPAARRQNSQNNFRTVSRVHQCLKGAVAAEGKQELLAAFYLDERVRLDLSSAPNEDKFRRN
jgi:hypothetical protein